MKSTFLIAFFSIMAFLGGVRVDAQTIRLNTADLKAIKAQMETSDKQAAVDAGIRFFNGTWKEALAEVRPYLWIATPIGVYLVSVCQKRSLP